MQNCIYNNVNTVGDLNRMWITLGFCGKVFKVSLGVSWLHGYIEFSESKESLKMLTHLTEVVAITG